MKTAFTPGPWHTGMRPGPIIYGDNGEEITQMFDGNSFLTPEENRANAKLIAAAPDLLNALAGLTRRMETMRTAMIRAGLEQWDRDWLSDGIIGEANGAIRKATE